MRALGLAGGVFVWVDGLWRLRAFQGRLHAADGLGQAPPMEASPDLTDPAWFLDHLDLQTQMARFVRADRDVLSRQPFLDPRWDRTGLPGAEIAGAMLEAPPDPRPRLNFIWHTSFCCSTVLAAVLDLPGLNLSLKEPRALTDLADLKRRQQGLKRPGLARAVFSLCGRRFEPGEQILVKPSNFANNLIGEAAEMTGGRMLMLYASCRSFLVSIVKAREERRSYVRHLFISLAADGHAPGRWSMDRLLRLTDLEMAALDWRMQMQAMRTAMEGLGDRAASLDGDRFLDQPGQTLEALDAFFGLGLGPARVQALAVSPTLARDVKGRGEDVGRQRRRAEAAEVGAELGPYLDRLVAWSAEASGAMGEDLPRRLI